MESDFPLGPWRGFWIRSDDPVRHLMVLEVTRADDHFAARGEDSGGVFTLEGPLGERGEERPWVKRYGDGTSLSCDSTHVGEATGFVGRWTQGEGRGEFAIWPGTSEKEPSHFLEALPTEAVTFRCVCGETLELPADAPGLEMDCPWCMKTVVAPAAGGQAMLVEPKPEPADPATSARCPGCGCAAAEAGSPCLLCGTATVEPEAFTLLSAALDQEIVSPDWADWMLRKFAWLIRTQGQEETFRRPLLLPDAKWWPEAWVPSEDAAVALLRALHRACGLQEIPLNLRVLDEEEQLLRDESDGPEASGCIYAPHASDEPAAIVIGTKHLEDRLSLSGIFAHGLGHLHFDQQLRRRPALPPDLEQTVDLIGVTLGFGALQVEAAFRFLSWRTPRRNPVYRAERIGYLSQAELCFTLALWSWGRKVDEVPPFLGANGRGYFKEAYRFFDDRPDLVGQLRAGVVS